MRSTPPFRTFLARASIVASLIAACVLPGSAQSRPALLLGTIDGVVTDTNLVSLAGATASILGSTIQVVTGPNGRFRILQLPPGQYILVVRHLGFAPSSTLLQVAGGDTLRMSLALARIATLDTVVVAAKQNSWRMQEFEDRRKLGFGQFMTQAEIEKRHSVFVVDLVRTFLSIDVSEGRAFTATAINHRAGCAFQVFLDGVALPAPVNLYDLPTPKELAGIEVYSGPATLPLLYKKAGTGFCGAILIWTKDGS